MTDAVNIADYYREHYGKESTCIAYGAPIGKIETYDEVTRIGLEPGRYFLYVSRMEPENNALWFGNRLKRRLRYETGVGWRCAVCAGLH